MTDDEHVDADDGDGRGFLSTGNDDNESKRSRSSELMFRVMLWSLGIAAVCGVGAVLTASFDVVGRVVGTAILTAGVSAVLWQSIDRIGVDRAIVRRLVDVAAGGFYLFTLLAIWDVGREWKMWGTAVAIFAAFTLAAGGLWLAERKERRITGLMLAVSSVPSFLCWLSAIWLDLSKDTEVFFAGVALTAWTSAAAGCMVGHTSDSEHRWRWLGVAAAVIGYGLSVVLIFEGHPSSKGLEKLTFVVGSVCAVLLHTSLSLLAKLTDGQKWLRIATGAVVFVCACCVDALVITDARGTGLLVRLTIASAILASAGSIAISFIGRRNARLEKLQGDAVDVADSSLTAVEVRCPRCGQQQCLALGRSECRSCKLGFEVQLFEPK